MGTGSLIGRSLLTPALRAVADKSAAELPAMIAEGAKSGILNKAASVGKFVPGFNSSEMFQNLQKAAGASTQAYEGLTKTSMDDILASGLDANRPGGYRANTADFIKAAADKIPGGKAIYEFMNYDPGAGWVRQAKIVDAVKEATQAYDPNNSNLKAAVEQYRKTGDPTALTQEMQNAQAQIGAKVKAIESLPVADDIDEAAGEGHVTEDEFAESQQRIRANSQALADKAAQMAPNLTMSTDDAISLAKDPSLGYTFDQAENEARLAAFASQKVGDNVTWDEIKQIVDSGAMGQTGVKWFDDLEQKIRGAKVVMNKGTNKEKVFNVGKDLIDHLDMANSIFKRTVVTTKARAWGNAILGNPVMRKMMGLNLMGPFSKNVAQAFNFIRGVEDSASEAITEHLINGEVGDFGRQYPTTMERSIGINPNMVGARYMANKAIQQGIEKGWFKKGDSYDKLSDEAKAQFDEALGSVNDIMNAQTNPQTRSIMQDALKGEGKKVDPASRGVVDQLAKAGKEGATQSDLGTSPLSNMYFDSSKAQKLFQHIKEKANGPDSNIAWKALDAMYNKAPSGYEKIDMAYKLAEFLTATRDGYTKEEMNVLRRFVRIQPNDITSSKMVDGQMRYTVNSTRGMEIANTAYMNYNAMPGIVKVMSRLPLIGSPFSSFMYGMMLKTGQTMLYNPSFFSKQNFAMKDFGGQQSPLERQEMNTKYYNYLKQPGMMRLPIISDMGSPVYLNAANVMPYYSMSMFQPSQAPVGTNNTSMPDELVNLVHQSPFFKTVFGSVIFDHMLQPALYSAAGLNEQPTNQFGTQLYPSDASALDKVGYTARDVTDSFIPGPLNVLMGLGLIGSQAPDAAVQAYPGYNTRQFVEATRGENQLGISSKEPAISRVIRSGLQSIGVPIQAPMNMTYNSNTGSFSSQ